VVSARYVLFPDGRHVNPPLEDLGRAAALVAGGTGQAPPATTLQPCLVLHRPDLLPPHHIREARTATLPQRGRPAHIRPEVRVRPNDDSLRKAVPLASPRGAMCGVMEAASQRRPSGMPSTLGMEIRENMPKARIFAPIGSSALDREPHLTYRREMPAHAPFV